MEKRSTFVQEIITECVIHASAEKVYSVISNLEKFPEWTKDIAFSGDVRSGGKMRIIVNDPESGPMRLKSEIEKMNERMILFRHTMAPIIFKCLHRYEIIPLTENKVRFINAEIFSGLAVPFVRKKKLLINARKFKDGFNASLKQTVEASHFAEGRF